LVTALPVPAAAGSPATAGAVETDTVQAGAPGAVDSTAADTARAGSAPIDAVAADTARAGSAPIDAVAADTVVATGSGAVDSLVTDSGAVGTATADSPDSAVAEPPLASPLPARLPDIPFGIGERFEFSLQYGPLKAGTAVLSVEGVEEVGEHTCYRVVSEARSNRLVSTFYKVRDRIVSCLDDVTLLTRRSSKKLREGDHRRDEQLVWDHEEGRVTATDGSTQAIVPGSRDILGAFYYVRTLDLEVGDRVPLRAHDDDTSYEMWLEVKRQETIDTPVGRFDCLVYEPQMETDGLFKRSGKLEVWLTRDAARMPVKMQSQIKIGAVSAILIDMERGRRPPSRGDGTG
jgi:hypothetical protein